MEFYWVFASDFALGLFVSLFLRLPGTLSDEAASSFFSLGLFGLRLSGVQCTFFIFKCITKKLGDVITALEALGVGGEFGIVDVLDLQSTKPRLVNKKKKRFQYVL